MDTIHKGFSTGCVQISSQKPGNRILALPEGQDRALEKGRASREGMGDNYAPEVTQARQTGSRVSWKAKRVAGTYHTNKISSAIFPCQAFFPIILSDHRAQPATEDDVCAVRLVPLPAETQRSSAQQPVLLTEPAPWQLTTPQDATNEKHVDF